MLAQKTRYFSPYKRLVVRRSHQHNDCGRLIILTQGQTYWFYLSISLEAKKLSLSGHTRLYYMFGLLLFSCVELNPVYILNNMLLTCALNGGHKLLVYLDVDARFNRVFVCKPIDSPKNVINSIFVWDVN